MKFKPNGDRILVRATGSVDVASRDTWDMDGSDSPTGSIRRGVVEAVGPGIYHPLTRERVPLEFQIGDVVLFGKYAGSEFVLDGSPFILMREDEVLATLVRETC